MKNTKFYQLYYSLSKKERNQFGDFVKLEMVNKNQNVILLWQNIQLLKNKNEDNFPGRKELYKAQFPKEVYDELKFNNILSDLFRLIETFLAFQSLKKDTFSLRLRTLEVMLNRSLNKIFVNNIKGLRKLHQQQKKTNEFHYFNQFLLEKSYDTFLMKTGKRIRDNRLQDKVDNLDHFYLYAKLKESCEMINRQNIVATEYQMSMLPELMEYLDGSLDQYQHKEEILIYYYNLKALQDQGDEYYYQFYKLLREHEQKFNETELIGLYNYARNYCIKQINNGNSKFLEEIFGIYQRLLDSELIFEDGFLTQWDYKNIITTALRLKKSSWTESFIEEYKSFLHPDNRMNAYKFNLASFYYETGNYSGVLDCLLNLEFTDIYYALGTKSLLLKTFYALSEVEAFYNHSDSFITYLRRNKQISDYQKKVHINMVLIAKQAFSVKIDYQLFRNHRAGDIKKIEDRIDSRSVTNKSWLKFVVNELKKIQKAD